MIPKLSISSPNYDKFLTISLKFSISPNLSTFLHHFPITSPSINSPSKNPYFPPFFSIISNFLQKSPKSNSISSPIYPLTSPQIKKSLENKGFPALHIIYEPPSTEHRFVKSYFNILHSKYSAIIVDFLHKFNFPHLPHRTILRVYFYSLLHKKEAIAETMTSNISFHNLCNLAYLLQLSYNLFVFCRIVL